MRTFSWGLRPQTPLTSEAWILIVCIVAIAAFAIGLYLGGLITERHMCAALGLRIGGGLK